MAQAILSKNKKAGGITCPDLKRYWHKKRHIDQWNRTESLEINSHMCGQIIHSKRVKNIY